MSRLSTAWLLPPAVLAASTSGYATEYLTVEQAQQALFPGTALTAVPVRLTAEQRQAIAQSSGVRVRASELRAWRTGAGGWFIVDEVLGKHEFITFALGLDLRGAVVGLEILSYRETYGGEVRNGKWRGQFPGKTAANALKLDGDIKNISGATLSCRHITDGVKRLLTTYELVLKTFR
ncbi:MAG: FMN-binding protein [Lacunisphaera sp.]|nr:FMN-binding protein [Lacunisphaera sp.]